jgi:NAD(P)-dependent dehydrogenase (short-subunit alcohol dehydrogenase family)
VSRSVELDDASRLHTGVLEGKVAVVTGAANGIGREVALQFAAAGAQVVLADVDPAGQTIADSIGRQATFLPLDVGDVARAGSVVPAALEAFGRLDVLCNVAGVSGSLRRFLDDDLRDIARVFAVDLFGLMHITHHVARHMASNGGGAIVNVASGAGVTPGVGMIPYRCAKAGVAHLTRCLAVELGEHGIRVNCVAPANIATDINSAFDKTVVRSLQPLPHQGVVRDVADSVVFLASDQAAHITGLVLPIDGGMHVGTPPRRPTAAQSTPKTDPEEQTT